VSKNPPSAPSSSVVRKSLLLNCSQEQAFRVFTEKMGRWWPASHHTGSLPFRDIVVEPRAGGHWYEIDTEDTAGQWGHVLAWEPPQRVVLSWHLDTKFKYQTELARASEIDIRFFAAGPAQTRMEFEHRHIERHGEGFEALRDTLDNGWPAILEAYAALSQEPAVNSGAQTLSS
jgi:uncharacterized protein YndB with AHSA1/START domain